VGEVSNGDAIATCLAIFEHGVDLIDTASIYGRGRAEELVGRAMRQRGHREQFYVATKPVWRGTITGSLRTRIL
jgi:aryl-alcohol dehydrogenase-like predicted oxidoreductase